MSFERRLNISLLSLGTKSVLKSSKISTSRLSVSLERVSTLGNILPLSIFDRNVTEISAFSANAACESCRCNRKYLTFFPNRFLISWVSIRLGLSFTASTLNLCFFLFFIAVVFAYSQQALTLDEAIAQAADRIERDIGPNKKIAVLNFISSSEGLSTYVIDELMDIFTNHKALEVTERSRMDAILRERNYQTSGEVSDAEIQTKILLVT